jgi:FkbM family methyltransferase
MAGIFVHLLPDRLRTVVAFSVARLAAQGRAVVRREGILLDLDLGDWNQRLYYLGATETRKLRLMRTLLPPRGVFVDVGGHVGLHTLTMARHLSVGGRVLAFEPMAENLACLRRNIELNELANVRVEPIALGDREATVGLFVPPGHRGGPTAGTRVQASEGWIQAGTARCRPLDACFEESRLDLMKLDVEGDEVAVLRGATRLLKTHQPVLVCEVTFEAVRNFVNEVLIGQMGYHARGVPRFEELPEISQDSCADVVLLPRGHSRMPGTRQAAAGP